MKYINYLYIFLFRTVLPSLRKSLCSLEVFSFPSEASKPMRKCLSVFIQRFFVILRNFIVKSIKCGKGWTALRLSSDCQLMFAIKSFEAWSLAFIKIPLGARNAIIVTSLCFSSSSVNNNAKSMHEAWASN